MRKISWGILSTANIGLEKVIPGMLKGEYIEVNAIASRNLETAKKGAQKVGITKAYGSYEELLADETIEAIYIPLPNHLHVEWTLKCLEAGKHVLCEKPLGLALKEVEDLYEKTKRFPHLKVMEAFMYRHHPQWQPVKKILADKGIGDMRSIHSVFSYFNDDPNNVRNMADIGGGGLLDIGCYCISLSRFLFDDEPKRVCGTLEYDPDFKTDRLASGVLEFEHGTATFTCGTQLANDRRAEVFGTKGKLQIIEPFVPQPHESTRIIHEIDEDRHEINLPPCDQYTLQVDLFSKAIIEDTDVFTPLSDAVNNMRVIDAVVRSSESGSWIHL